MLLIYFVEVFPFFLSCLRSYEKLLLALSSATLAFNGAFVPVIARNHGPAPERQFCDMGPEPCRNNVMECRPATNKGPNKPQGVPNVKISKIWHSRFKKSNAICVGRIQLRDMHPMIIAQEGL